MWDSRIRQDGNFKTKLKFTENRTFILPHLPQNVKGETVFLRTFFIAKNAKGPFGKYVLIQLRSSH